MSSKVYRLISLLVLAGTAAALSEVNQKCIAEFNDNWSNDNLVGTWYMIRRFTMFGAYVPSPSCPEMVFTRPTADTVQQYKDKYNDPTLPYNLDDNPVLVTNHAFTNGLVTGHNAAKFYVLAPNSTMILNRDGYIMNVYRQLTPKYIMYFECALSNFKWLLSNDKNPPLAEVDELIKNTPEFKNMVQQKYCATCC